MAFARTGPDDARSNLSQWLERAGIHRLPTWLRKRRIDILTYRYGMVVMAFLLFIGGIGFDSWVRGFSSPFSGGTKMLIIWNQIGGGNDPGLDTLDIWVVSLDYPGCLYSQ